MKLLDQVMAVMRRKHYSRRAEKTYKLWIMAFLRFHRVLRRLLPARLPEEPIEMVNRQGQLFAKSNGKGELTASAAPDDHDSLHHIQPTTEVTGLADECK